MTRPRNKKAILKVKKFKRKGLSFRSIAKIMGKDVKTIFSWHKMGTPPVDKLA